MAKHAENKKHNFLFILLIFCVLIVLGIIAYLYIIPYTLNLNPKNTNIIGNTDTSTYAPNTILEHTSSTYKILEDAPHLHSDEFDLTVANGISTINGKIFNTSNTPVTDVNCLYTLKDSNNNVVYEFSIYAKQIEPQNSFGFTSVVILDLSNVDDYNVKLYKK